MASAISVSQRHTGCSDPKLDIPSYAEKKQSIHPKLP